MAERGPRRMLPDPHRSGRVRIGASLLAAALAVIACGGGDSGSGATTSTTWPSPAAAWCAELPAMSYEARKAAIEQLEEGGPGEGDPGTAGSDPDRADAEELCGDLVAATEDAAALEEEASTISSETVSLDPFCDHDVMRATITNETDVPVAFVGATVHRVDTEPVNEAATLAANWSIAPGEEVEVTNPVINRGEGSCLHIGDLFHADGSRIDAALPGTSASGPTTADDAATWLPAVVEREVEWFVDEDPDELASFIDVRNPGYREYLAGDVPGAGTPREVRWCETFDGPNDDTVVVKFRSRTDAFSYTDEDGELVEVDARNETEIAVARRGTNGAWRLLTTSFYFGYRMCVGVDEVVDDLRAGGVLPEDADVDGLRTLDALGALPGLSDEARAVIAARDDGN